MPIEENGDGRMAFDGLFQSGFLRLRQVLRFDTEQQGFELPKRAAGNGQSGGFEQQKSLDGTCPGGGPCCWPIVADSVPRLIKRGRMGR